jgi:L-ribulose-5-phosphate 3-epimerase
MSIGITTLVLPADWSFEETLDTITGAGYSALELAVRDTGYCSIESSANELSNLKVRAEAAGVEVMGICPSARSRPRDLMSGDESVRSESIKLFVQMIDIANAIGVDTVLVVPGRMSATTYYDDAYMYALDGMRRLADIADSKGVNLAIEYVWNNFLLSPIEFARFCDEIDNPRVGFYFDSGNMVHTGYPEHWVRICARHLMAFHLKDFLRNEREWTPLLEGDVDFPAVMTELRAAGYSGHLISEVEPSVASLESTAEVIRKIAAM